MSTLHGILLFVVLQRLAELAWSARNTRRLLSRGAVEAGRGHYPLIVALHAAWIAAIAVAVPADRAPQPALLGLFALLQLARVWVVASLGPYWTTRVISLPSAPLVRRGPYRWMRHPNYAVVAAELAVLPAAFGAWWIAVLFSLLNLAVIRHRIGVEEEALAPRLQSSRAASSGAAVAGQMESSRLR